MIKYEKKNYTVKDYKFLWKRESKATGKWSSFDQNELRGYDLKINNPKFGKDECGFLLNVSRGHHLKDTSNQWQVWFISAGINIALKNRFEFEDVENAKEFAEKAFVQIMNSEESELKERILDLGRINKEMFI